MSEKLQADEKETLISFDETPADAVIFTYNRRWQAHLEGKLGLKPIMNNGFGGKEYQLPKGMIKLPRAPRKLSDTAKRKLAERLHRNRFLGAQSLVPVGK